MRGATRIYGLDLNEDKFKVATEMGCTDCFNPTKDPGAKDWLLSKEKWGIDFNYLLNMIHDSFMSSPTSIVVNGGKMGFAMELILTPIIHRMIEEKKNLG